MPNIKYTQQISTGKKDITSLNLKNHNDANQKIKAVKSNLQQGIKDNLELRNRTSNATSAITNLKQVAKATDLNTQKVLLDNAKSSVTKLINDLKDPSVARTTMTNADTAITALINFERRPTQVFFQNLAGALETVGAGLGNTLRAALGLAGGVNPNNDAAAALDKSKVYESVANILVEKVTNVENLFKIQMQIQETQSNEQQSALEMYKAEKNNLESVDTEAVSNKMVAQQQNKIRAASAKTLEVRAKNDLNIKATNNLDNARLS